MSLPVYVRDNTLLALGNNNQKPDYAWHEGMAFQLFNLDDGATAVSEVPAADGAARWLPWGPRCSSFRTRCCCSFIFMSGRAKRCVR